MFKEDLKTRISVISDYERAILKQSNPLRRQKQLNELMDARENLKLQFYYADSMHNEEILSLLDDEATQYVRFEEIIINCTKTTKSQFDAHLQGIMDTCKDSQIFDTNNVVSQAKASLINIASKALHSNGFTRHYRLKQIDNCIDVLLNQYPEEKIENIPSSVDCCTGLEDSEIEK